MKFTFAILFLLLDQSFAVSNNPTLDYLFKLKLGDIVKDLPTTFDSKAFSFDLVKKEKKLYSLSLDLKEQMSGKFPLHKGLKGYCFKNTGSGDFVIPRYFFITEDLTKRYEINEDFQIVSLLIKKMPGANKHRTCKLEDVVDNSKTIVRKE